MKNENQQVVTYKQEARRLEKFLVAKAVKLAYSDMLEAIAAVHDAKDWNTLVGMAYEVVTQEAALEHIDLATLYRHWDRLGNIPTVQHGDDVDTIEVAFLHFPVGTHREAIWHWFEAMNPKFVVGEVMSGKRQETVPFFRVKPGDVASAAASVKDDAQSTPTPAMEASGVSVGLTLNTAEYADVDVYVPTEVPGADWLFRVSLDKGLGIVLDDADPQFSPNRDVEFDVAEMDPPADVLARFQEVRPQALAILEKIRDTEAAIPPKGWIVATEDTLDAFNPWGYPRAILPVFEKRMGGDGQPTYDLTIFQEGADYRVAHGAVMLADRLGTPKAAAERAMKWYESNAQPAALSPFVVSYEEDGVPGVQVYHCAAINAEQAAAQFETRNAEASPSHGVPAEDYTVIGAVPVWLHNLEPGDKVFWNDPDQGLSSGEYLIGRINTESGHIEGLGNTVGLYQEGGSEAEVLPGELSRVN